MVTESKHSRPIDETEAFFELLAHFQGSRLDAQRSPGPLHYAKILSMHYTDDNVKHRSVETARDPISPTEPQPIPVTFTRASEDEDANPPQEHSADNNVLAISGSMQALNDTDPEGVLETHDGEATPQPDRMASATASAPGTPVYLLHSLSPVPELTSAESNNSLDLLAEIDNAFAAIHPELPMPARVKTPTPSSPLSNRASSSTQPPRPQNLQLQQATTTSSTADDLAPMPAVPVTPKATEAAPTTPKATTELIDLNSLRQVLYERRQSQSRAHKPSPLAQIMGPEILAAQRSRANSTDRGRLPSTSRSRISSVSSHRGADGTAIAAPPRGMPLSIQPATDGNVSAEFGIRARIRSIRAADYAKRISYVSATETNVDAPLPSEPISPPTQTSVHSPPKQDSPLVSRAPVTRHAGMDHGGDIERRSSATSHTSRVSRVSSSSSRARTFHKSDV
jgi:hypothetical protein